MRKLLLLIAALFTATVMNLRAETVTNIKYIDANGQEQTCSSATVVENSATSLVTWRSTTTKGWYVVTDTITLPEGAICKGAVHLILADGAKLTANGCIEVSGNDNSLTIYGQSAQTGKLMAIGDGPNAGIGGSGEYPAGSNITINGGKVMAIGGYNAAGIGGGFEGTASNIHIHGGLVIAMGGMDGIAGIGNGVNATTPASNILVNPALTLKADNSNPPTVVIASTRTATTDVTADLVDQRYVTISSKSADIYTREVTLGNCGTICLPKQITAMEGVEALYVPADKDQTALYCSEVPLNDVVAGGAYIFKANADYVTFDLEGAAVTQPVNNDHMIGWLAPDSVLAETLAYYLLANNELIQLKAGHIIRQYRAFIDLAQILENTTIPYPIFENIALNINKTSGMVDVDARPKGYVDVNADRKKIINGQLLIIRDGVKYNAIGQQIK